MPRRGRSPDRLIFYIALLIALGLFLASATGLISFATLTPKPGWKPPKCRNPDDFVSSSHGGSFSFGVPSKYVKVEVVSQKLKWIKASVTSDRNVIWHVRYYAKIKYRAKPFYAILNSNPDRACFYVEWAGDSPSEAPYKYPEPVKLIPEIIVSEKPRTGYYYLQTIGKVLKGEGIHTIDVSYKPLGMWAGPDITIRFKKDDGSYVKVPPCAGWSFHPCIELHDLDKFVKGEVTTSHKLKEFAEIFGTDPRKTPVDVCDLFVRYPAGDWPKPRLEVEPVGSIQPGSTGRIKITWRTPSGKPFTLSHLSYVNLIVRGPSSMSSPDRLRATYKLVQKQVKVPDGETVVEVRFPKPGYYLLRVERDWGGYVVWDEEVVKVGEFAETPQAAKPVFEIASGKAELKGWKDRNWKWVAGEWNVKATVKAKPEAESGQKFRLVFRAYLPTLAYPMSWKKPVAEKTYEGTASKLPKTYTWSDSRKKDVPYAGKVSELVVIATLYQWDEYQERWVSVDAKQWKAGLKTVKETPTKVKAEEKDVQPSEGTEPGVPDISAGIGGDKPVKDAGEPVNIGIYASGKGVAEVDFGDGEKVTLPVEPGPNLVSHTYREPGEYEVTVKVYDADGDPVNADAKQVSVQPSKPFWQEIVEILQAFLDWLLSLLGVK